MSGQEKTHTGTRNESENVFEHAWKIHNYLTTFIQIADNKAGAIIAISTLSAALFSLVPPSIALWQKVLLAFSVVTLVIGLILALLVIKPRVNNKSKDGLIFWGNIRVFEHYPEYQAAFFETSPLGDVLKHNYYLAEVANQKYKMLHRAMLWQCVALPGFWLAILLTLS
jgi:hypothetical protein